MKCLCLVVVVSLLLVLIFVEYSDGFHPNVGLDEYQIMTKYGYPYEKHQVITSDGYILEMSRVLPRSPKDYKNNSLVFKVYPNLKTKVPREPVLLMHGMTASGREFVSNDAEKALAFILVNHGYDVFIPNARGTTLSRRHVTLDPDVDAKEFFDFSWHEIATLDQTAIIDYILQLTGFQKLSYIGHSQGGTTFFAMTAFRPEYNSKIKIGFSFGGPGIMRYSANPFERRLSLFVEDLQEMTQRLEIFEFLKYASVFLDLAKILADEKFGLRAMLFNILDLSNIISPYTSDLALIPVIFSSMPSGASVNQVFHYLQSIKKGDFRLYDYANKSRNVEKYGSEIPPRYNLSAITCPVVLYYSKHDRFMRSKDTLLMTKLIPNATPVEVKVRNFGHGDYVLGRGVIDFVFKDLLWRMRTTN